VELLLGQFEFRIRALYGMVQVYMVWRQRTHDGEIRVWPVWLVVNGGIRDFDDRVIKNGCESEDESFICETRPFFSFTFHVPVHRRACCLES
jgi:hypothetical protein